MVTVVNFGSTKTAQIISVVRDLGYPCEEKHWKDFSASAYDLMQGNGTPGEHDKIIFSGSPTFLTEVDHAPYLERFSCIQQGKVPVLGICFGHQVMGIVHGAKIFRGKPIREEISIHIVKDDKLFEGLTPVTRMTEDHTEGISLPSSFIHLAYSFDYSIEAMRHPNLPLWGTQFHPEVSGESGKKLIYNFLKI